jgi:Arc/MetJ-type ribon-helix-helix transcriptional regulator
MHLSITNDVYELVQAEMAEGSYVPVSELIKKAFDSLQEPRIAHEAIQESYDDIAAGRIQSAKDFDREFRARKSIGPSA